MSIKLINKDDVKEIDFEENITIEELLKKEEIPIETVVIKQNGETVTEDEIINDNDEIEVIKVIYGGYSTPIILLIILLNLLRTYQYVPFLHVALKPILLHEDVVLQKLSIHFHIILVLKHPHFLYPY